MNSFDHTAEKLNKLEEKIAHLTERKRRLKTAAQKAETKLAQRKRFIVGEVLLDLAERNEKYRILLRSTLDKHLRDERKRQIVGLPAQVTPCMPESAGTTADAE